LSRGIPGESFKFIPCVEVEIPRGGGSTPPPNCLGYSKKQAARRVNDNDIMDQRPGRFVVLYADYFLVVLGFLYRLFLSHI